MKKLLYFIIMVLFCFPFCVVNAEDLGCYSGVFDFSAGDKNIPCSKISEATLTFKEKSTGNDYSDYFTYSTTAITPKNTVTFSSGIEIGEVIVSDGTNSSTIKIKNKDYVKQVETTTTTVVSTTTTTANQNKATYTVTLDYNDNTPTKALTCDVKATNDTCTVTLPTMETSTFTGWGKAKTCTEGNVGTIIVNSNVTYYACYSTNKTTTDIQSDALYLDSLTLRNDQESLDFGTFSKKKFDYTLKVLNSVNKIDVSAKAEDGIIIDISGNENLVVGENEIVIKLTNDNNESTEYTVVVTKLKEGESLSTVNYLSTLVVGGYKLGFDKEKFDYTLTIDNKLDSLEITYEPEDPENDVVISGNTKLKNNSVISIIVTNVENNSSVYKITIKKDSKSMLLLYGAAAIVIILILLLIILVIIKSKKNGSKKTNDKNQNTKSNSNDVEVMNF